MSYIRPLKTAVDFKFPTGAYTRPLKSAVNFSYIVSGGGGTTNNFKVFDGTSFVAGVLKYWNGTTWATATYKYWNGTIWV